MPTPAHYSPQAATRRTMLLGLAQTRPEGGPAWRAAVLSLGQLAQQQRLAAEAPRPGRPTGLTPSELFTRLTTSHVFDADRTELRQRFLYGSHATRSQLIEWAKHEVSARKKAEKQVASAAC